MCPTWGSGRCRQVGVKSRPEAVPVSPAPYGRGRKRNVTKLSTVPHIASELAARLGWPDDAPRKSLPSTDRVPLTGAFVLDYLPDCRAPAPMNACAKEGQPPSYMARAPTDIRSLARSHTQIAIKVLAGIAKDGTNESARVAAAVALLDRGWRKPPQAHTGEDGQGPIKVLIRHIVDGREEHRPVLIDAVPNETCETDGEG